MIDVQGLFKSFGGHLALRGVDLRVSEGECVVLIGPNGAGKTTLLRILAGLSRPTSGHVYIAGLDLAHDAEPIRRRIGFLSHHPLLYDDLSAEENLRFYGTMYDVPALAARIATLLSEVGLTMRRHDLVRTYSRGMRQRLSIARALLHDPPILLLDEPYTGLDQQAADMLDALLQQVGATRRTVVLTTHNLDQGLKLGRHVILLAQGEIKFKMMGDDADANKFRIAYRTLATSGGG